jgi:hypothetical protein
VGEGSERFGSLAPRRLKAQQRLQEASLWIVVMDDLVREASCGFPRDLPRVETRARKRS